MLRSVEVLQTAQGAIAFLIADAVKVILASRADINQWFPKGEPYCPGGGSGQKHRINFYILCRRASRFWAAIPFRERFRWDPRHFFYFF
jgi:hypothetical protein